MKPPYLNPLFRWSFAFCAAIVFAFTAHAGMDKNPVVENLQRPFDWTGFYIGGNIGGAFSEYEFTGSGGDTEGHLFSEVDVAGQFFEQAPFFLGRDVFFIDRFDKERRPNREDFIGAVLGGGQIGYQHQFGHWVLGIEGDFDRTSIRNAQNFRDARTTLILDEKGTTLTGDTLFFGRREAQTNWIGTVRGKVGYATGPLLFYATGGVAFAQIDVFAHDVANTLFTLEAMDGDSPISLPSGKGPTSFSVHNVNTNFDKDDDWMVGWTAGAGLEIAFNDAVSLALEYRHNDFSDETFNFNSLNTSVIHSGSTNVNFTGDQVTVRMNVLLNHMFGHGAYTSASPATNNVAVKSPFGNENSVQVGYTKSKDADKWSAKDKEVTKVEEPFSWTGFYMGVNAGGVWTDYDFNEFDAEVNATPIFEANSPTAANASVDSPNGADMLPASFIGFHVPSLDGGSDDSIIGGGQVGYQYQWNNWVFGVEADFSGLSTDKKTDFASSAIGAIDEKAIAFPTLYTERKATVDWMATARAKFGYARGPVMLYVTGGGAWAKVRTWATDRAVVDFLVPDDPFDTFSGHDSNNTNDEDVAFGWTVGGGGEWAFSKIASLAMEYRHSEFDSADAHYDPHHSAIFSHGNSVDLDSDQVTVRVNLLLGHMGPGH